MGIDSSFLQYPQIGGRQQAPQLTSAIETSDIAVSTAPSKFNFEELQDIFIEKGLNALITKLKELNIADIKVTTDAQTGKTTVTATIDGVEYSFTGTKSDTVSDSPDVVDNGNPTNGTDTTTVTGKGISVDRTQSAMKQIKEFLAELKNRYPDIYEKCADGLINAVGGESSMLLIHSTNINVSHYTGDQFYMSKQDKTDCFLLDVINYALGITTDLGGTARQNFLKDLGADGAPLEMDVIDLMNYLLGENEVGVNYFYSMSGKEAPIWETYSGEPAKLNQIGDSNYFEKDGKYYHKVDERYKKIGNEYYVWDKQNQTYCKLHPDFYEKAKATIGTEDNTYMYEVDLADVQEAIKTARAVAGRGASTSNTNNSGAAGTPAGGASSTEVLGTGTVDNLVLNTAGGNSDILGDFDKTGYDSFVNSIIDQWADTIPLHNGIFDYNIIANLLTMSANGTDIHALNNAVLRYVQDGKVSDPGNIVDFSQQFMERFISIILNDDEVKNASLSDTVDGGPKGKAINNAIAKFLEKFGATKDSDGNYTNLDFNKVVNYVLEYDDVPYTSQIYGTQFNSLKEEIEYFRTNGVTEYNENTKAYFQELAHYNSEFFEDYEFSDAHPYDYFNDVMRLLKLPVSGSTSYDDLVDKQVNSLIIFLQNANERGVISQLYNPASSWWDADTSGLVAPYLRVGIDSGNNITITDDSIKCVQMYLDTLKSKGINPSNDEYCKIFGFTLDDDTEAIKQKLNKLYSTMDGATQDGNGNYKVPIKSYYTTLSGMGAHCYDGLDYKQIGQGYNCDVISLFSKDQLNEVVDRMNMRDKVHNTIIDYGFTIEDIYYLAGGGPHNVARNSNYLESNSNDLTVLTGEKLLRGLKNGALQKEVFDYGWGVNQELMNALYRAAGINADSDSTETQVQKMQQLIDKWFDKDGSISPEKLLVLLTGADGGECYVKQNTYSAKFVEAFCMQNNGINYDYQYNIDEWFEQLADGSYILKPGKSLDTSTNKYILTNRELVNSIYDLDPYDNLKRVKETLDHMANGDFTQEEINAILQNYQYDHFMKYFYDDLVALYGTPSTETPSAPSNKPEDTPEEVTIKAEDCLKDMDSAAEKLGLTSSKTQGVYYQFSNMGSYLYIWNPVEKKFKAFSINSRNADGSINQEFTQTGKAVNRTEANIYYEALLEAYKNGYNFTVNFPWVCEKDGVYYEYNKERGIFQKKEA